MLRIDNIVGEFHSTKRSCAQVKDARLHTLHALRLWRSVSGQHKDNACANRVFAVSQPQLDTDAGGVVTDEISHPQRFDARPRRKEVSFRDRIFLAHLDDLPAIRFPTIKPGRNLLKARFHQGLQFRVSEDIGVVILDGSDHHVADRGRVERAKE